MEERCLEMGDRVKTTNLFNPEGEAVADLRKVVHEEHIKLRQKNAIGIIGKGVPGIHGDAVLVHHMDEDGLGRLNGKTAAYFTGELELVFA
jgi:hypothetical protein